MLEDVLNQVNHKEFKCDEFKNKRMVVRKYKVKKMLQSLFLSMLLNKVIHIIHR